MCRQSFAPASGQTLPRKIQLGPGQMVTVSRAVRHRTRPVGGRSVNLTFEAANAETTRAGEAQKRDFLGGSLSVHVENEICMEVLGFAVLLIWLEMPLPDCYIDCQKYRSAEMGRIVNSRQLSGFVD